MSFTLCSDIKPSPTLSLHYSSAKVQQTISQVSGVILPKSLAQHTGCVCSHLTHAHTHIFNYNLKKHLASCDQVIKVLLQHFTAYNILQCIYSHILYMCPCMNVLHVVVAVHSILHALLHSIIGYGFLHSNPILDKCLFAPI